MKHVAVFCGSSSGNHSIYTEKAEKLGIYLAQQNINLVYGGGKIGLMGVLANKMLEYNGIVIGIIPKLLVHKEVIHPHITKTIITKTMSERKVKISKLCDAYIALPGGFGTLDEIFEALTLNQLGIEQKPIGLLNSNNYFDALLQQIDVMVKEGFLHKNNKDLLIHASSVETLIKKLNNYKAPKPTKITQKTVK